MSSSTRASSRMKEASLPLLLQLAAVPHVIVRLQPGNLFNKQGFHLVGYGCTTCIGNSGDLDESVSAAITENDVAAAVLKANRNFEGRVHPLTWANYLASPSLVVAYALAGTVDIGFEKEHIGLGKDGKEVYLGIYGS
ncbi:hypothetical protein ACQ4PT_020068 [Festuca glaucescens]